MIYFLWSLPALVVAAAIATGRLSVTAAAVAGFLVSVPVAMFAGADPFGPSQLGQALARGIWIGITIAPYILGGLLFWQVGASASPTVDMQSDPRARRRLLFFACFLVGPFAESATGFGVGMIGTIALLRGMGLAPRYLMVFALLSQTMIPWGAMASGTMLAAAYARMSATTLALHSAAPVTLLMLVWLPLYWRSAHLAGLPATIAEHMRETGWIAASLGLLILATAMIGPEAAMLASYGPLIVARHLLDRRPDTQALRESLRSVLPYALLIAGLTASRLVPELRDLLSGLGRIAPYADLPALAPLFHAGCLLFVGALLTAAARGQLARLSIEVRSTWRTGRQAVWTVFLFSMMAEVLTGAGIARAVARSLFATLHADALWVIPAPSAALGILANSGSASNSLFLPAVAALVVQAGLSLPWSIAVQHVASTSLGLFSPVRMSIAANLASGAGEERAVYRMLVPYLIAAMVLMTAAAWCAVRFG